MDERIVGRQPERTATDGSGVDGAEDSTAQGWQGGWAAWWQAFWDGRSQQDESWKPSPAYVVAPDPAD